jgi:putative transcriptional regulator
MRSLRFKRAMAWFGVLLAAALLATPARPTTEDASPSTTLAGQLLVASPDIGDPRFFHAVVLIVQHSKTGAFGIIVNRPAGEQSWAGLLDAIGQTDPELTGNVQIYSGGPVQPWLGFVVHSADYHRVETIDIDGKVAMTASSEILRDIGHNRGPQKTLIAFGYTGWGPGQLESELDRHGWFTIPEDPGLIFGDDREHVWDKAKARETFPL